MHKKLEQLFFLLLLFLFFCTKAPLGLNLGNGGNLCKENEKQAVLMMKSELIDDYGHLSSWRSDQDCCQWRGIVCSNRTGHIKILDLHVTEFSSSDKSSFKPLRGKINPSLLELRHLTYLDLSQNLFLGTHFPYNIGSLPRLRYLNLSHSGFTGTISPFLKNLSGLKFLGLGSSSDYHFFDLRKPDWISYLSNLTELDLSGNPLQGIDWLQILNNLPHLTSLQLASCFSVDNKTVLPSPINSSSLTQLDLSGNNLSNYLLSPLLSNISSKLLYLNLSSNLLQGSVADDFGDMASLEYLSLANNKFTGGIPKSFGNLCSLQYLDLSSNNLSMQFLDMMQNLSGCAEKTLEILYLYDTNIKGVFPDITRFSSLKGLDLGRNQLKGTIPENIGVMSNLEALHLSWNSMHGVITETHFSNLSRLRVLMLSGNSFTLNVSHSWVPPFLLDYIGLQSCKMGPDFPKWLQSQHNYSLLDISNVGINDSTPTWFWNNLSPKLYYLNLSYNNLSGVVPDFSPKLVSLTIADLGNNHFDGPLPLLPNNLEGISLAKNRMSGPISFICKITSGLLNYLDLNSNLLSGVLPSCFTHWPNLIFLNMAQNNLSGKIPTSIGSLFQLETLILHTNVLSGELPYSLKNCSRMKLIGLGGNKLSGEIPSWIGESLPHLQYLGLYSNQLRGSIPQQLCKLINVQTLDLSANNINGTIPGCFNNFRAMAEGNLSKFIGRNFTSVEYDRSSPINYLGSASILWKGRKYESKRNLGLFRIIDLSSNELEGNIPMEISKLTKLTQLNLSMNKLTGAIPDGFGDLKQLESLDLSQNHLTGRIPVSMANLNFLSQLNLSFNRLSGRIPLGTQLQSFDASEFANNLALCGPPTTQKCPGDETPQPPPLKTDGPDNQEPEDDEFLKWFYISMSIGFILSFWGVSGTLLIKRSCRNAYFHFLDEASEWILDKLECLNEDCRSCFTK